MKLVQKFVSEISETLFIHFLVSTIFETIYSPIGFRNFRNHFIHRLVLEISETISETIFTNDTTYGLCCLNYSWHKKRIYWYICVNKKVILLLIVNLNIPEKRNIKYKKCNKFNVVLYLKIRCLSCNVRFFKMAKLEIFKHSRIPFWKNFTKFEALNKWTIS